MSARLINGTRIAGEIREALRPRAAAFTARHGRPPGLGIVLAGASAASEIYVRNKVQAAAGVGIAAELLRLPEEARLGELLELVDRLNRSDRHDGILVQSPLPGGMDREAALKVFDAIDPGKDVDGFHPSNVGRIVQNRPALVPCTPAGVIEMLEREGIAVAGARAVVIGRSDIVGKPLALLLLHRDATVTVCHSRTRDLQDIVRTGDIVVAAIGRPAFVTREFVKPGSTVIDVGINRLTDQTAVDALFGSDSTRRQDFARRGSIVVGDVHPNVAEVAGALTPVPGGVGPMTIAVLLRNTLRAAETRMARL